MKKIFTILLVCLSLNTFSQIIDFSTRLVSEKASSREKLWLPYTFYQNDTTLEGETGKDYFFWSNALYYDDTLHHTVWVRSYHGDGKYAFLPLTKLIKGDTNESYFETKTIEGGEDIPIINRSLSYNLIDDTIVGPQFTTSYQDDSIVFLNKQFKKHFTLFFDKAAAGVHSSFLNTSPIIKAKNKWWMVGYERYTPDLYTVVIVNSANNGRTWQAVDSFPAVINRFRGEEPCIIKGKGDTLIVFMRSDIGNIMWSSRSADGINWSAPQQDFKGGNRPQALLTKDSIIVTAPSRLYGRNRQGKELTYLNDTFFYDNITLKNDVSLYTVIQVSWDNGHKWYQFLVDEERCEQQRLLPDGASLVELPNGRIRIYWSTAFGGFTGNDFADHRYTDFTLGAIEGNLNFVGGTSIRPQKVEDPVNGTRVQLEVDSNNFNITSFGVDNTILSNNLILPQGKLGIGMLNPTYAFDFKSTSYARFNNFNTNNGLKFENGAGALVGQLVRSDAFDGAGIHVSSLSGIAFKSDNALGITSVADMYLNASGRLGIKTTSPLQTLDVQGTMRLSETPLSTNTNDSALYKDSTGQIRTKITRLVGSSSLDFGNTGAGQNADITVTISGVAAGDPVVVGYSSCPSNTNFTAFCSATNTVTVRFNNYSAGAIDPASITFNITVLK